MNSKEQMPAATAAASANGTEPSELPDHLKKALQDAYPSPNGRIAAKVMEQIRAQREAEEKEAEERRRRAEKAEIRRRRNGLIMKYGGLAACMVILSGALVIATPLMDRAADHADMGQPQYEAAYAADAAAPEMAVYTENAIAAFSGTDGDSALYSDALPAPGADQKKSGEMSIAETPDAITSDPAATDAATSDNADNAAEEVLTEAEENVPMTAAAGKPKAVETEEETEAPVTLFSTRTAADEDNSHTTAAAEADPLTDLTDSVSTDNEAFLQYLFTENHLTEADYQAWMQQNGYTSPGDWTPAELCTAFSLSQTLYEAAGIQ